jgi:hypothetical protein
VLILAAILFFPQKSKAAVNFTVSPSVISNTYFGSITLQVTGLTNTETVVVQKFLDANTNSTVDAGDWLMQQFSLADGAASVFTNGSIAVTNFNVPCDLDGATNGSITAKLNQSADFAQRIVGNYLFVLSSPGGHFSAMTNSLMITNFPFGQKFAGNVVSNGTSTTIANALVFIGAPDSSGNLNFFAGTTANNAGAYSIQLLPGRYMLLAVKSNFVGSFKAVTNLFLGSGVTITTNLNLIAGTNTISGKIVDASNNSIGIPGFFQPVGSQSGLFGAGVTDSNGNFTVRVTADQWGLAHGNQAMMLHGYLTIRSNPSANTTTGNVANLTIALKSATALFYGSVKDTSGNPMAGVWIFNEDNIDVNTFTNAGEGVTDVNGNYVAAALGGSNTWLLGVDNSHFFPEYVFSQGEQTNIGVGMAVPFNVTATPLAPTISAPTYFSSGQFQMAVSGVALQNYTVQMSTNLSSTNWSSLFITNATSSSFLFNDLNAANQQRFYRILVGP